MINENINRDKALFERIAGGDATAFNEVFRLYYQPLYHNALKLTRSEYWAEEMVQEGLLQVWDRRDRLRQIDHPAAWLYRIISFKCFDHIRRNKLQVRVQYAIDQASGNDPGVEQRNVADLNTLRQLIATAIDNLPEQQRLIYRLRQEEELSYLEIAERVGISSNTVRNHLVRATRAVRQFILSHGEFLPLFIYMLPFF